MKKYFVIGNPINHSLSPELHNFWIKENNINAIYEKIKLEENELENFIKRLRNDEIHGINVTVPFKNKVIKFLDKLSLEVETTGSVNTIYKNGNDIIGHNTDVAGFELGLRHSKINVLYKTILILGAGGVVPSIIFSLLSMGCKKIFLSNRTIEKAEKIKEKFDDIDILKWGEIPDFDIIINATSVGLKGDSLDLNLNVKDKIFYDVIYNPKETQFLKKAKETGNKIENGKLMFIYQANQSFSIWNNVIPKIDYKALKILE
ncbi:MAG: shikimate dehydrogenase [Candidatus Pelagibacter sp.]